MGHFGEGVDADLFDFEGDGTGSGGQPACGGDIVPAAHDGFVHDKAGGTERLGVHHADAVTHGACGHGHHAAQLAAAENGEEAAGFDDGGLAELLRGVEEVAQAGSSCAKTSSVRAARQAARRS